MTPYEIVMLLHCHTTPNPDESWPYKHTKLRDDTIDWFKNQELIHAHSLQTTAKGDALVRGLCQVPMPVQVWVIPDAK